MRARLLTLCSALTLAATTITAAPAIAYAHTGATHTSVDRGLTPFFLPPTLVLSTIVLVVGAYFIVAAAREGRASDR